MWVLLVCIGIVIAILLIRENEKKEEERQQQLKEEKKIQITEVANKWRQNQIYQRVLSRSVEIINQLIGQEQSIICYEDEVMMRHMMVYLILLSGMRIELCSQSMYELIFNNGDFDCRNDGYSYDKVYEVFDLSGYQSLTNLQIDAFLQALEEDIRSKIPGKLTYKRGREGAFGISVDKYRQYMKKESII